MRMLNVENQSAQFKAIVEWIFFDWSVSTHNLAVHPQPCHLFNWKRKRTSNVVLVDSDVPRALVVAFDRSLEELLIVFLTIPFFVPNLRCYVIPPYTPSLPKSFPLAIGSLLQQDCWMTAVMHDCLPYDKFGPSDPREQRVDNNNPLSLLIWIGERVHMGWVCHVHAEMQPISISCSFEPHIW